MLKDYTSIEIKMNIPNSISIFRLACSFFLFFLLIFEADIIAFFLFFLCSLSDLVDGYIARKRNQCTSLGGLLDIIGDFGLIFTSILALVLKGIYPLWVLLLMLFMFLQFFLSSIFVRELIYDPLGKYYGAFLMIMLFLTFIDINNYLYYLIPITILTYTLFSLTTRVLYLYKILKIDRKTPDTNKKETLQEVKVRRS